MRRSRIAYIPEELAWIKRNRDLPRAELRDRFAVLFGRKDVTADNIKSLCSRMKWPAGPEARRRGKGKSYIFTAEETAWLRANATIPGPELLEAFLAAFPGRVITAGQLISWRKRNGIRTGRDTRFQPGLTPWTNGRKIGSHPNSAATQFTAGQAPHNARPIGYESLSRDGYVLICVDRPNPYRPHQKTHMAFKHKELWISANGPIPDGHVLKCLDGDKTNCDPANWEAVPIGLLPRLNGKSRREYDRAPAELKPTIMTIAKLEHAARQARRQNRSKDQ